MGISLRIEKNIVFAVILIIIVMSFIILTVFMLGSELKHYIG